MPAIVVPVKYVPGTWSEKSLEADFTLDRDNVDGEIDEVNQYAVEAALRIKEAWPVDGETVSVIAVTVGPDKAVEALRKAIAMGANTAVLLADPAVAGSDALATARVIDALIGYVEDHVIDSPVSLIVTGSASSDGFTGAISGMLAEIRHMPAITSAEKFAVVTADDGASYTLTGTRVAPDGVWELSAPLPALLSVTDGAEQFRFPNFKSLAAAKKAEIPTVSLADIGVEPATVGANGSLTAVTAAAKQPGRTRGTVIYDRGDAAATAAAIADFLDERGLLN